MSQDKAVKVKMFRDAGGELIREDAVETRMLEMGPPARQEDEDFEAYKKRRSEERTSVKNYLKGRRAVWEV